MTTPTLHEILQRLREEPDDSMEWEEAYKATRARLLAVCEVLDGIIPALNNSPDTTEELHTWITQKLAAALKL